MSEAPILNTGAEAEAIAQRFVQARLQASALNTFPGPLPEDMAGGYRIQDAAIGLWPDEIAGWKVGRVPPERQAEVHAERLAGPIFSRAVRLAGGDLPFDAFVGGFAAVEAEFVLRLGQDAPARRTDWTPDEVRDLIDAVFCGVETACSPLSLINALGPTVTVSDFGNNGGLILGPAIEDWRERRLEDLTCETFIDGVSVGRASAAALPGGPLASVAFLLGHCTARGRPLKAGQLISTGAATGVHEISIGQSARIAFDGYASIACHPVAARPYRPEAAGRMAAASR